MVAKTPNQRALRADGMAVCAQYRLKYLFVVFAPAGHAWGVRVPLAFVCSDVTTARFACV